MSTTPSYTLVGINYWPEPTGNAPYNTDLAEELERHGEVNVVTGFPHYPWWQKQLNHSDDGYIAQHGKMNLIRRNHLVPRRHSNISRALMEITFGVNAIFSGRLSGPKVILTSPAMLSSAIILAWIRIANPRTKVLLWVQDLYEQGLKETGQKVGFFSKTIFRIENWMLKNADRVVMAHPGFMDAKNLSIQERAKFVALQNWSQFSFDPSESSAVTKSKYGLGDSRIILHIGNMGVKQGLEGVIQAAKEAATRSLNTVFVFVGGGNQLEQLKSLSKDLDRVVFIPPVSEEELANLLQAADLLLVHERPGIREMSIPSKLTTYFLSGKPVLVCSEPDSLAARAVLDNGTGFWVKSGDPVDLVSKIDTLDLEKSMRVAEKAKAFAEVNLRKSEALARFIAIINEI